MDSLKQRLTFRGKDAVTFTSRKYFAFWLKCRLLVVVMEKKQELSYMLSKKQEMGFDTGF